MVLPDLPRSRARSVVLFALCLFAITVAAPTVGADSDLLPQASASPVIAGCNVFPTDNVWNMPVDGLPLDPNSAIYVSTIGRDNPFHPDFGSGTWNGGPIGIPYTTVQGTQPKVPITFQYQDESDPGPYPIPPNPPIEGGAASSGDRHILIVDQANCVLYEVFAAYPQAGGSWKGGSGAVFDLKSNALRPSSWTSADAAGLPILPGLVQYDEAASGEVRHAIRFTAPQTRQAFVWPARHYASSLTGAQYPPMGQRFRLRAGFDVSGYAPQAQVILTALKKYGMILSDNGSPWYIAGAPDERWNNDLLGQLKRLSGSDFEAVDESSLMVDPNSAQVKGGAVAAPIPSPGTNPQHRFELGFKMLADLIPDVAGIALENERHNPSNGDGLQQTTTGLMVWRKADNWTAFTNGSRTWVNGPYAVAERSNDDRFPWEAP